MDDSRLIRRLEALCPPEPGEARERAMLAARTQLLSRSHHPPGRRSAAIGRPRRARRGRGFAIIAVAGLALTGSALAATGVWNPFAGDQPAGAPSRSNTVMQARPPVDGGTPGRPGEGGGGRRRQPESGHGSRGAVASSELPVDLSGVPEAGQSFEPSASAPEAPGQPAPGGGADPQGPGGPTGGGGPVRPPAKEPPAQEPPAEEPPAPQHTTTSVGCGLITATTLRCSVRVSGEVSAPTGQVTFEVLEGSGSAGQFSSSSCVLIESNGVSNLCQVEYGPAQPPGFAVAHYGGDAGHAPSTSAPFEV